ncbi:MAG: aldo/keto reductase [Anaerovibrio sp.]|nr:aldo/keto reductase [Anaerovibrio sp.]
MAVYIKKYISALLCTLMLWGCLGCAAATKAEDTTKSAGALTRDMGNMPTKNALKYTIKLNSGYSMPVLGLGTWTLRDETCEAAVYTAIKCGYRLIDTARYYGNEEAVGRGIKKAINEGIIKREDLFVTSKIMPGDYTRPDKAIDDSLAALGLSYIDLMLIHQPGSNDEGVYKALERGVHSGKLHSIGISNYYTPEAFERINKIAEIIPAVVQNENHPYYQNTVLQDYLRRYGTVVESWYPFGGRGNTDKVLKNDTIAAIADHHGKTPAQIVLRWQIQAGYIVIPGSSNSAHIAENVNVFDFELTADEMQSMKKLDKQARFENW